MTRKRQPRAARIVAVRLACPHLSSRAIAREVGCSSGLVRTTLVKRGLRLAKNSRTPHKLLPHQRQSIADAYAAGEKIYAIAHEFGVGGSYVCKIARGAGIPLRRQQRK